MNPRPRCGKCKRELPRGRPLKDPCRCAGPRLTEAAIECVCGGFWERREGTTRLQHFGKMIAACRIPE